MCYLKLIALAITNFIRKCIKLLPNFLSYCILAGSIFSCLIILAPELFDRVPVVSYFISKHELPMAYELQGEVLIIKDDAVIESDIRIYIGGYYAKASTAEPFRLSFVSPSSKRFCVVIQYVIDGRTHEHVQIINCPNGTNVIERKFIIRV